jgi:carbonic anhydrase
MTIRSPAEGGIMFISALLERNRRFAATDIRTQAPAIPFIPNQLSFVFTCIDPRTEPAGFLGIELGDAIVERVVGGGSPPPSCKTSPTSATWSKPRPRLAPGKYCRLRTQRE